MKALRLMFGIQVGPPPSMVVERLRFIELSRAAIRRTRPGR